MKKINNILLVLVLFFAAFIRLYKIDNLSYFYDELDAGLQAYFFKTNFSDYNQNFAPTHFQSIGDWRTPLYIYFVALFGDFRLTSAIFGIASVFVFYKITNSKTGAILFAITPWHIHYSRIGFEVSLMLFCMLLAYYFYQKNRSYLSTLFFIASAYTYSTSKLFIVLFLPFLFYKRLNIKLIFFGLLLLTPMIKDTVQGRAGYRFSYTNIAHNPNASTEINQQRQEFNIEKYGLKLGQSPDLTSKIVFNKASLVADKFIKNYLSSFSTDFLFLSGDTNLRHTPANTLLLITFIPFLILGLVKFPDKNFLAWISLSPIPFSLTGDSTGPHATRLILMLPPLLYFASKGAKYIFSKSHFTYYFLLITCLTNFYFFYQNYLYFYPNKSASYWNTNLDKVWPLLEKYQFQKVFLSKSYESFVSSFLYNHKQLLPHNFAFTRDFSTSNLPDGFTGYNFQNKYYFGHLEWSGLVSSQKDQKDAALFVVTQADINNLRAQQAVSYKILETIKSSYESVPDLFLIKLE